MPVRNSVIHRRARYQTQYGEEQRSEKAPATRRADGTDFDQLLPPGVSPINAARLVEDLSGEASCSSFSKRALIARRLWTS
jgi:hypothetical protein